MKNSLYKIVLAAILGLSTAVPIASFATQYTSTDVEEFTNLETKILQKIDVDKMYNNIKSLSKTPRVAGTDQEEAAVTYIRKQFESYGYKTEIQTFTFNDYTAPHTIELALDHFTQTLNPLAFEYSIDGDVSGEVISAGLGKVNELKHLDLAGKIALLQRGDISFVDKVRNVTAKGAVGVIIYNNAPENVSGSLGSANKSSIPAVLLTKVDGDKLLNYIKKNPGTKASLKIEGSKVDNNTSHNVIATKSPINNKNKKKLSKVKVTNDIIVIGSHHDSVAGAPGANDDASGTAMTLELARVLKNIPSETEIRFITFGAEEVGLIGSTHYVENLSKDEISRIVANFNLDMVGSMDAGKLILQTTDNKPNLVTDLAQAASTKLNGEPTPFNQGDSSDHVPFSKAGIPAALFIHNPAEPWYHKPEDTIDKISKKKLQDVAEIVSLSVWNQIRVDHYEK
jgi:aminopeptidase YwaD